MVLGFSFQLLGINFGIIDIAFIVILLICLIAGLAKGFVNFILSTFKGLISLIAAFFLCKPVAGLLGKFLQQPVYDRFLAWINGMGELFTTTLPASAAERAEVINQGLEEFHLPSFLDKILVEKLSTTESSTLGIAISEYLTGLVLVIVSFIGIMILVRIILLILRKLFKKGTKKSVVGGIDRFLGAVFGLAIGVIIVSVVCMGITFLTNSSYLESVSNWIVSDMHLDDTTVKSLGKFIYDNNPLVLLLELL